MIVLSMYDTVDVVKRAVANGACGYLMKDAPHPHEAGPEQDERAPIRSAGITPAQQQEGAAS